MVIHPPNQHPVKDDSLDTLEQLCQDPPNASETPLLRRVHPVQKNLQKRARAKQFSHALAKVLYAEGGYLKRAYGRSLDCTTCITQEVDGSVHTHYCGSRWCMVCNRIRTAKAIHAYLPVAEAWGDDAFFVTLTVQNCVGWELKKTIQAMLKAFTSCQRTMKRTMGIPLMAIRKIEVTYNPTTDTYHPHFHCIVNGEVEAEALRFLWLDRAPTNVSPLAQDVRKLDNTGMIEVFKYFTKLLTTDKNGKKGVDAPSLNVIFSQIKGLRTYQPVGFKIKDYAMEDVDLFDPDGELNVVAVDGAFKRHGDIVNWIWMQDYADWVDPETGECLTDYTPSDKWRDLCDSIAHSAVRNETPILKDSG